MIIGKREPVWEESGVQNPLSNQAFAREDIPGSAAPPDATALQVFWPRDGGYSDRYVAGGMYPVNKWKRLILELPPQPRDAVLRVDPCTKPGTLLIAGMRFSVREDRHCSVKFRSAGDMAAVQLEELVLLPEERCLSMVSLGIDAKCYLPPLPESLFGRALRFEVWIRFEPAADEALLKLAPLVGRLEERRLIGDRAAWLEQNLAVMREQNAALVQQVQAAAQIEAELGQAKHSLEEQGNTARFLGAELGHVRAELDWTRNEMDRLRKENERRKLALRAAESTFQLRWTLPAFLTRKKQRGKATEATPSGYEFHLESPKAFNLIYDSVTITGWCFSKSGDYIQSIRASVGEAKHEGSYGRKRFDVHSVFPNYEHSMRSGFQIEVKDLPARFTLVIEVLDDRDTWQPVTSVEGIVANSIWGLELGRRRPDTAIVDAGEKYRRIMEVTAKEGRLFQKEIRSMAQHPRVSILMPVYNTPADYLREAIRSVKAQVYPHWELCIADDASTSETVQEILAEAARSDSRIIVHRCARNGGIAAASNAALAKATGDLVALMDHDDLLSPVAALRIAQVHLGHGADFIYSDEGHINPAGEFLGGIYRPAFSLSYLRSHPYIVHLVAFSARLLRDMGGFQETLTISQDYDLILRAAERAASIVHIPEILYLWRQVPTSAGHQQQEKVMEISTGVLREHLQRSGVAGEVVPGFAFNFFRVRPKIDLEKCSLAIIIPTKNQAPLLRRCVESLEETLPENLPRRLVIVDHESEEEETRELLSELSSRHTVLPYSGTFNYSAINNFGVRRGAGDAEFLLFCNNDIEATTPGWMEALLEAAANEKVGAVAPMLLYPDRETVQHAGVSVGLRGPAEHLGKMLSSCDTEGLRLPGYQGLLWVTREVSAITTACALVRRRAFEAVQGFSEEMQVGFNDTDLCLRLWQNDYSVLYCGGTTVIHHESASRGKSYATDPHPADSRRFLENWGWLISRGDPFYNPNFRVDSTSWETLSPNGRSAKPKSRSYAGPSSLFLK